MKLKRIKIDGFKSFADKVDLELNSNIIAIVGPNGSGKSNIVDAIRWVLGSQSLKSLRGLKEMSDVIFSGSETRNPLKRAEVALEFDNTDNYLNSTFPLVEVKRILYSNGENEYFINNCKVRLKDITNLFLDSGIGADELNIISQGNIADIINSKPQDRRVILESASKVLKYKTRKIESIKKLDKAKDNLDKIKLVIEELESIKEPLKEQSEIAQKYLDLESELKDLEISLITYDITNYHDEYQKIEQNQKEIEQEKIAKEVLISKYNSNMENYQTKILELENKIREKQEENNQITSRLAQVNSQKVMLIESQNYDINNEKINEEYLKTLEEEKEVSKQIEVISYTIKTLEKELKTLKDELFTTTKDLENNLNKKKTLDNNYQIKLRETLKIQSQIDILKNNIDEDLTMPKSVKNIINHPNLKGIHGPISKLIKTDANYLNAINVALGSALNNVVVDNELCASKAIDYLKENKLGRVTFLPLNVIKGRKLDEDILNTSLKQPGFVGVASNLLSYNPIYKEVIEASLGNVLVCTNFDTMNSLAKKFNYRYRVVSLDGEIIHTGGSITGGSLKKQNSSLDDLVNLENYQKKLNEATKSNDKILKELEEVNEMSNNIMKNKNDLNEKIYQLTSRLTNNYHELDVLKDKNEEITNKAKRVSTYQNKEVDKEINNLIKLEKELETKKAIMTKELEELQQEKSDLSSKTFSEDKNRRDNTTILNNLINSLNQNEVKKNKIDVKMDYLLNELNEKYHLTYEKAKKDYILDFESDLARTKVDSLKKEMESLGMVNLGSISEYTRIKERYDFLNLQQEDLVLSVSDLENVILEMDKKMEERLTTTFAKIADEFAIVFKELFRGGKGVLKLTDPDNILESGIEIIAEPPGKKLNNISLLSGGEKTLTAIALLFAILNVFPVPFCVLDEVEAALDEANVDMFGNYLQKQKEKSEYILITHKKRTMEYADTLYGITMQEQGVSKIVSVKLEEA